MVIGSIGRSPSLGRFEADADDAGLFLCLDVRSAAIVDRTIYILLLTQLLL